MNEERILLAHGNGGRFMRELITEVFARHLANPVLDTDADAVALPGLNGEIMVTTDGFTVQPLEFPGGNLGSLFDRRSTVGRGLPGGKLLSFASPKET